MFPLHVWMTGSGTQFNMNVNEVISNRCCQLAVRLSGARPLFIRNDHVNMAQSSKRLISLGDVYRGSGQYDVALDSLRYGIARCDIGEGPRSGKGHRQDRAHPT